MFPIKNSLEEDEQILWQGKISPKGAVMFSLKITLFLLLVFEICFVFIFIIADVGLSDKLNIFFELQMGLIFPIILFFILWLNTKDFYYMVTNKKIRIKYGQESTVYMIKDIISLKIKYGFFEKNKKHGTVKIKVRNRRITPLRNHLYSVPEPEKVYAIIKSHINLN